MQFIEQANSTTDPTQKQHSSTQVYTSEKFAQQSRLDIKTHFKATETFQYTHFLHCHLTGVKKGFIKGKAFRLLRTNSQSSI